MLSPSRGTAAWKRKYFYLTSFYSTPFWPSLNSSCTREWILSYVQIYWRAKEFNSHLPHISLRCAVWSCISSSYTCVPSLATPKWDRNWGMELWWGSEQWSMSSYVVSVLCTDTIQEELGLLQLGYFSPFLYFPSQWIVSCVIPLNIR